jgi:hypothetical protein
MPSYLEQVSLIGSGETSQIPQCSAWSFAAGTFDQRRGWSIFRMIKNNTHGVAVDTEKVKFAAEVHHCRSCTLV